MNKAQLKYDVVIVGLGKTGMSCVRFLYRKGLNIAVTDSRDVPPFLTDIKREFPEVSVYTGNFNEDVLLAAEQIVVSPGVSLKEPAIKNAISRGIPVIGDVEIFCQHVTAPVIAITGSNGKSTVTTLVAEMAKQSGLKTKAGGNLGTPVLDLLQDETPDVYVIELSSFQLEVTFSLNAHASCVLNITPDHMDRYECLDDYANAKKKIYSGRGAMILNRDDELIVGMSDKTRQTIYFSLSHPEKSHYGVIKQAEEAWLCRGDNKLINESDLLIKGKHNIANALAAMALASTLNVPESAMVQTLKRFTGLAHRCQKIAVINDVTWYNDSKATNVGACIASINGLYPYGDIILIAGGDSKDADLGKLGAVANKHVKHVILLGVDAEKLARVFDSDLPVTFVEDINAAVIEANNIANSGEIVLLAPACASLDMYQDYQQRGDVFVSSVKALEAK